MKSKYKIGSIIFVLCSILFLSYGGLSYASENLLLNKPVTYSGVEGGKNTDGTWKNKHLIGEKAVDGDLETRWSADKKDNQWLIADIGETTTIKEIVLNFHAESPDYEIEVSKDGENYTSIYSEKKGLSGQPVKRTIKIDQTDIRFIKYQQNKQFTHSNGQKYGSSLIALEAYQTPRKPTKIQLIPEKETISEKRTKKLTYQIEPIGLEIDEDQLIWSSDNEQVATISDSGVVTGKKAGTSKINVEIKNTDLKAYSTIEVMAGNTQYETMRTRWKERLLGNGSMSDDTDVKAYLTKISTDGAALWESLNKNNDRTELWPQKESDTVSADYTTQFTNINKLTLSYYSPTTALYQKPEVLEEIIKAIDFMIVTKKYDGAYYTGNWWDWQIGSAQQLVNTLIMLHDDLINQDYATLVRFTKPIIGYNKKPTSQWPSGTATGANLTDIGLSVLGSAILLEDDSRMELVQKDVPTVLKNVTKGDGLYIDGSLIQHSHFPYNGSYGNVLLKGVSLIQAILTGTPWEIKDDNMNNLFNVVDKGYLDLIHQGKMPAMVSGRSISRAPKVNPFTTELETGKETMANLALIQQFAPTELKNKINSQIKAWLTTSKYNFFEDPRDFESLINLKFIAKNPDISAEEKVNFLRVYGSMDRAFQKNANYSVGISMYSNRIANFEFGNTENKRGWHTADGMVYLYNYDEKQFDEGYWTTIDSYRLPGTTVDTRIIEDGKDSGAKSPQTWVGGSSNGKIGAVGMALDKSNVHNMNLKAKKSWFLLDGYIVNLGAGITGESTDSIETIIENRMIDLGTDTISVNGKIENQPKMAVGNFKGWINLATSDKKNNVGYIIPKGDTALTLNTDTRVGRYIDINEYFINDKTYTQSYFTISAEHGKTVTQDSYEYLTVPGKTDQELASFYNQREKELTTLMNNENIQAIETNKQILANVWEANQKIKDITINTPASIILNYKTANLIEITLADPTHKQKEITLTLDDTITETLQADDGFVIDGKNLTLTTSGLAGTSKSITVKTDKLIPITPEPVVIVTDNSDATKSDIHVQTSEQQQATIQLLDQNQEILETKATEKDGTVIFTVDKQDVEQTLGIIAQEVDKDPSAEVSIIIPKLISDIPQTEKPKVTVNQDDNKTTSTITVEILNPEEQTLIQLFSETGKLLQEKLTNEQGKAIFEVTKQDKVQNLNIVAIENGKTASEPVVVSIDKLKEDKEPAKPINPPKTPPTDKNDSLVGWLPNTGEKVLASIGTLGIICILVGSIMLIVRSKKSHKQ